MATVLDLAACMVEHVLSHLSLLDGVRFLATCKALWELEPAVLDVSSLTVHLPTEEAAVVWAAWLSRRKQRLGVLSLTCTGQLSGSGAARGAVAHVWSALQRSPLRQLRLSWGQGVGLELMHTLGEFELPQLEELALGGHVFRVGRALAQLSALSALALCLQPEEYGSVVLEEGCFPASLQALSLEGFSGIEAFLHVERLPRLLQLTLTGCGYFSPLVAQLTSLTRLELEQCDTDSLPAGLSDLRHLQELVAEGGRLGGVSAQVLGSLASLSALWLGPSLRYGDRRRGSPAPLPPLDGASWPPQLQRLAVLGNHAARGRGPLLRLSPDNAPPPLKWLRCNLMDAVAGAENLWRLSALQRLELRVPSTTVRGYQQLSAALGGLPSLRRLAFLGYPTPSGSRGGCLRQYGDASDLAAQFAALHPRLEVSAADVASGWQGQLGCAEE